MLVSEIFHSIQGEGEFTGVPSVFVRTSGCNLRCRWCDTPYASWEPEGEDLEVGEILRRVDRCPSRYCVLTGGEPMVARGIHELAGSLQAGGRHVTIETAGTLAPGGIACDLASLSPKLRNSTPDAATAGAWAARHERDRWRPKAVREWIERYPYQLKFVVQGPDDIGEIEGMIGALGIPVPAHKILLMPEGREAAVLRARKAWLVEECKARGHRFCDRLQIELFGNTRGT
ncbi:MAG TPA: 7-carboxy-7-deazaguanine synthase QueE [Verrucomicrobiae bacterium]|nr:7-carboxy-7-deazaguanine synthase QueE [Verrucomicrobiae bacterium]